MWARQTFEEFQRDLAEAQAANEFMRALGLYQPPPSAFRDGPAKGKKVPFGFNPRAFTEQVEMVVGMAS